METRESEIWKPIPGYEGLYEVSSWGNVKSLERIVKGSYRNLNQKVKEKILKPYLSFGYNIITLKKNGNGKHFRICRLVAKMFIDLFNDGEVVNHLNEDKLDDYYKNLEWVSIRENTTYSTHSKTSLYKGVSYDHACNNKKWKATVYYNGKTRYLGRYFNEKEARQAYLDALKEYGLTNKYATENQEKS
jgi:hypothetical protein